jgi:hypothetical protein
MVVAIVIIVVIVAHRYFPRAKIVLLAAQGLSNDVIAALGHITLKGFVESASTICRRSNNKAPFPANVNLSLPKISSACRHSGLEELIEATVRQKCESVLDRKAGVQRKIRSRLATRLLHRTNGSHRRRGPTDIKRHGAGIGDEVLRPEEPLRYVRVLASPQLSIPERLWPTPDEFGSAGSRQNNFPEFAATIFHSTR